MCPVRTVVIGGQPCACWVRFLPILQDLRRRLRTLRWWRLSNRCGCDRVHLPPSSGRACHLVLPHPPQRRWWTRRVRSTVTIETTRTGVGGRGDSGVGFALLGLRRRRFSSSIWPWSWIYSRADVISESSRDVASGSETIYDRVTPGPHRANVVGFSPEFGFFTYFASVPFRNPRPLLQRRLFLWRLHLYF